MAAFTCASQQPISLWPATKMSSSLAVASYGGHRFGPTLEFRGLRIQHHSKSSLVSLSIKKPRVCRQQGGIVCEAQETAINIPIVNDTTWESIVLKSTEPVLVDFWAPWCGPCRLLDPVVGEIAQQYIGKLKVYKLNTDDSPAVANQYGVRSIPTIMIFVNGQKKDTIIGAVPKTTLTASIEKFL